MIIDTSVNPLPPAGLYVQARNSVADPWEDMYITYEHALTRQLAQSAEVNSHYTFTKTRVIKRTIKHISGGLFRIKVKVLRLHDADAFMIKIKQEPVSAMWRVRVGEKSGYINAIDDAAGKLIYRALYFQDTDMTFDDALIGTFDTRKKARKAVVAAIIKHLSAGEHTASDLRQEVSK